MQNSYKVGNYYLDKNQMKLLKSDDNALVIAGAGSGKTLTILGKINYLIEYKNVLPKEILVISFTNSSVDDIKSKMKYNCDVLTFHKLAAKILDNLKISYSIVSSNLLAYIIKEYLNICSRKEQYTILKFLKIDMNYNIFVNSKYFDGLCKVIETYINLFKANNYNYKKILDSRYTKIEKQMITIIFQIYKAYILEKRSSGKMDFDDLIISGTNYVKYIPPLYKYIIIDEFQDTSYIRLNLVKELAKKGNSKIIVVGDDWQSIYRFSGCNLEIFLNFAKYFQNVTPIKLVNTYRNSIELITIASKFINKNKLQIKKDLFSNIHVKNPIVFVPCKNKKYSLKMVLEEILLNTNDIMIISRNKNDIYEYIDDNYIVDLDKNIIVFNGIKVKYYTIHKSKGLEAEDVIVLNCNNNYLGFPNKIEDNIIIEKLMKSNEIRYAEERRLFYVAITRCKKKVYLLYQKNTPSVFIRETKKIVKATLHSVYYFKY